MEQTYDEIDLRQLLYMLLKRWWIIVTATVLCVIIGTIITVYFMKPTYEAYTILFVGREISQGEVAVDKNINSDEINVNSKLVDDYRGLAVSRRVIEEVIDNLQITKSYEEISSHITVKQKQSDTRIFSITYTDTERSNIKEIVNEVAKVLIVKAEEIVKVENLQVIDWAVMPQSPVKPNKTINIAISAVLGMVSGVFTIFVIEFFDNTIKTPEDIEHNLNITVLGTIPQFEGEARGK